jgi:IS1 family transposase/transposase-like protein
MIAPACDHKRTLKWGRNRKGCQRHKCLECGLTWSEYRPHPIGSMKIPLDKAIMVLRTLLEGSSVRSTVRLTGVAKGTILDLLILIGERCEAFWEKRMVNLPAKDVEVDEIWGYVFCKNRHAVTHGYEDAGDCWAYIAMERTTKLILTYYIGPRDSWNCAMFCKALAEATAGRFQLSTDGFGPYISAVPEWLGDRGIDYGQIVKILAKSRPETTEARYSPSEIMAVKKHIVLGKPKRDRICTSHMERGNLSVRMGIRRMTRLTNAYSKKWENHEAAMALWFTFYNFVRIHMTLKTTPAVAAGIATEPWTVERLLNELAEVA